MAKVTYIRCDKCGVDFPEVHNVRFEDRAYVNVGGAWLCRTCAGALSVLQFIADVLMPKSLDDKTKGNL